MYDLNLAWTSSTTHSTLDATLTLASTLGYTEVFLNHAPTTPLPNSNTQIANPLPSIPPNPSHPKVRHRITLTFAEPPPNHRIQSLTPHYALIALRPTTEKAFSAACISIPDAPLISLDLTSRLPFPLRPKPCQAALARGMRFEISYTQGIAAADVRARTSFIANLTALIRVTRGRGLVLSSGASRALELRGPADVVNLLAVWGLGTERALEGMRSIPRAIIANESVKRNGYRGVVEIIQVAALPNANQKDDPSKDSVEKQQQPTSKAGAKQTKKRANADPPSSPSGGGGAQPLSKRQAKKQRLAALQTT